MIRCLLHQPALRRSLDSGAQLSSDARAHLEQCSRCRAAFAAERAVVNALAAKPEPVSAPPFLRARIMNSLRQPEPQSRRPVFTWAAATAVVALALTLVATKPKSAPAAHSSVQSALPSSVFAAPSLPPLPALENPLQTEIENLRNDTRNAARALAANFLPAPAR